MSEERFALGGFLAWFGITGAWWALAFAPLPDAEPWLAAARTVCFGTLPNGHDSLACCPAMTGGTPLLPPPAAPAIGLPPAADIAIVPIPRDLWIPESPVAPSDRPRGPPLTA